MDNLLLFINFSVFLQTPPTSHIACPKMLGDRKKNHPPFPFVMKSAGARLKEGTDTLIGFFSYCPIHEVPNLRGVDRQESRQGKYLVRSRLVIGWRWIPVRGRCSRGGQANFFKSPQICKFLGSFCYLKFAHFVGVPIHKLQIRKFFWIICQLQITAKLCLKKVLKIVFWNDIYYIQIWIRVCYTFCKSMYFRVSGTLKSAKRKKIGSSKRKSAKNYWSPQLCGFAICGTYLRTAHLWEAVIAIQNMYWSCCAVDSVCKIRHDARL